MDIKRSKKLDDGVRVWFDNGWYYAHGIKTLGDPGDLGNRTMRTMWSWVFHLREKNWWHEQLEDRFIKEVSKYF